MKPVAFAAKLSPYPRICFLDVHILTVTRPRKHIKPQFSQTILLPNVYNNPGHTPEGQGMTPQQLQADFDRFYEDFFMYVSALLHLSLADNLGRDLCGYGHLLEMHVCDNVGDHLMGNVYARFEWEAEAAKAAENLNDRWYAMRPLHCELSPVSDFREACCRQNELGECKREGCVRGLIKISGNELIGLETDSATSCTCVTPRNPWSPPFTRVSGWAGGRSRRMGTQRQVGIWDGHQEVLQSYGTTGREGGCRLQIIVTEEQMAGGKGHGGTSGDIDIEAL